LSSYKLDLFVKIVLCFKVYLKHIDYFMTENLYIIFSEEMLTFDVVLPYIKFSPCAITFSSFGGGWRIAYLIDPGSYAGWS